MANHQAAEAALLCQGESQVWRRPPPRPRCAQRARRRLQLGGRPIAHAAATCPPPASCSHPYPRQVPNGAAGLHLLGRVCRATGRDAAAAAWFAKALRLDPLMWGAYEALCALGAHTRMGRAGVWGLSGD